MKMIIYELYPRFDSRKSFYGKAHVIDHENGIIELRSYSTIVARIENGKITENGLHGYSQTTNRHIREFFKQFNHWEAI